MLNTIDTIIRAVNAAVLGLLILIGSSMFGIAIVHIFFRYVLNDSLSWSEELLKILLIWFGLLSASMIAARREHVSIVVFKQMFPVRVERIIDLFAESMVFIASVTMTVIGVRMVLLAGIRKTPALHFPYSWMYAAIVVGFALMSLYSLRNLIADLTDRQRKPAVTG